MLRVYTERILRYVQPDGTVDEDSLEAGFKALDRNKDGRITLEDLVYFAKVHQCNFLKNGSGAGTAEQIPDGFIRYSESSKM